jgi:hypothetical protein
MTWLPFIIVLAVFAVLVWALAWIRADAFYRRNRRRRGHW